MIKEMTGADWIFLFAVLIGAAGVLLGLIRLFWYKKVHILTPLIIWIGSIFLSALVLFWGLKIPVELPCNIKTDSEWVEFFFAFHGSIRLFVVDYSLADVLKDASCVGVKSSSIRDYLGFLTVVAPLLTFSAVLSFVKDFIPHVRLPFNMLNDLYIFSELNEKSIALAESIYKKRRYFSKIVFTGVASKGEAQNNDELLDRARMIRAICFKKEVTSINFHKPLTLVPFLHRLPFLGKLMFFAINQEGTENVKIATSIRNAYGDREYTRLYIFSSSTEAAIFAKSTENEKVEIRRIDEARSVVYNKLYNMEVQRDKNGTPDLFLSAKASNNENVISAVIVGMGQYGTEMLKALTWFCQMDDHRIKINAFDMGASVEKQLKIRCPELLDKDHNRVYRDGDAQYDITIHESTDVESEKFIEKIKAITDATYVFVALGSDEANIEASVYLRRLFERNGTKPMIHTVVYNSDKVHILAKKEYDIEYIGDVKSMYSYDVIINFQLEAQALKIHQRWPGNTETNIYTDEYNYRSSMASALHLNALIACGIRSPRMKENIDDLCKLEHRRWNAYMRTEGYIYGKKNHLAKQHHDLVPYNQLTLTEKDKDMRIVLLSVLDASKLERELPGWIKRIQDWWKKRRDKE